MKYDAEIKKHLIGNAIHLIGQGGFECATTKELTYCRGNLPDLKMNEVYIYRLFGNKERLFEAAFVCLDQELFDNFRNGVDSLGGFEQDTKERLWQFFVQAWRFILRDEERCRCYVRYYYSIYFKDRASLMHKQLFGGMVAHMAPIFRQEADVTSILHSVFTALLDFAIRVYNGDLVDNDANRPHVFNVLYNMMSTYFRDGVTVS